MKHINPAEEFYRERIEQIDPKFISEEPLSIDFIREFKDELDWEALSWSQNFNAAVIKEFKDYIVWYYLLSNQADKEKFMKKYKWEIKEGKF